MQASSNEMQRMGAAMNGMPESSPTPSSSVVSQIALHELQTGNGSSQIQNLNMQGSSNNFDPSAASHDDFFDHMLSTIPSWTDLVKSPWDLANSTAGGKTLACENGLHFASPFDESSLLAARLRQHQISGDTPAVKQLMLPISAQQHQQLFLSAMSGRPPPPPSANASAVEAGGLLPLPLSPLGNPLTDSDASFKTPNSTTVAEEIFNGFGGGSIHRSENQQQHFHQPQNASMPQQSYGGTPSPATASTAGTSITSGGGGGNSQVAPPRQRVRARRGQATDPHSIAERLRRERIADRMKALQELVPNANKTDKASMLDEIIDYVKFLQLQVKVLSMSRLGGAGAVALSSLTSPPRVVRLGEEEHWRRARR
ncbi:hypothetical protein HPP92_016898 [Vanilla planifolia]|uniref:BHLH domain-containing protein n=2 Tax=Vanilla planifolia TaxID=51239 RepID=A0A835QP35_VANPL|nr:hypothetical protein HPP92_016898 [Vanilla planifolia]